MKKEYNLKTMKQRPTKAYTIDEIKVGISIRLDHDLLENLKTEAARLGIPYQTLINSILHRFTTGELIDKANRKTGS